MSRYGLLAGVLAAQGLMLISGLPARAQGAMLVPVSAFAQPPSSAPLPDSAARFRVTWRPRQGPAQVQQWQLNRLAQQIGWIKGPGTEEIWRRDASGIRLARVLRGHQHVIDYSAGELRALNVALDWAELASLFPESGLPLLKAATHRRPGLPQPFHGRIDGEQVDLLWDPVARLPVRLARSGPRGQVLFERTAWHATAPADWPQAGAGTDHYQRLDAADFGDMPYHPVVRQAQAHDQRAGWRKVHAD